MSHALIITGGGAPKALEDLHLESYRFVVVADSGIEFAVKHGLFADIWVGDFDSAQIRPERVGETIHKDHDMKLESDTELALMIGRSGGWLRIPSSVAADIGWIIFFRRIAL